MSAIPSDADVVVIGGGIVGCSLAYHLAKAGCRNILLLEKHQIGSGTTWHSAALVTVLRGSPTLAALARYSANLYASLEQETGQATGWRQNGHLTIAASKDRLDSLRHSASTARSFDLDVEIIGAAYIAAKWPLLNTTDLHGALWSPSSGQTNPTDTCQALLKGARALGAESFLLVTGSQQAVRDSHWLRSQFQSDESLCLADVTSAYAVIGVCGPRSRELLSRASSADFSNACFPFQTAQYIEIGYAQALAIRVSYTGELGWELYVPTEFAVGVLETLLRERAEFGLRLAGVNAMGSLRIERGFRSWGHDIGPTVSPLEAGLGFAVSFNKPHRFLGREALIRQREQGIARRLSSFVFDTAEAFPHHHEPIYRDGRRCGSVSSASFGHSLGRAVVLGWIMSGGVDPEGIAQSRFEIEVADRRYPVTAHLRAPVDPLGRRMRS